MEEARDKRAELALPRESNDTENVLEMHCERSEVRMIVKRKEHIEERKLRFHQ